MNDCSPARPTPNQHPLTGAHQQADDLQATQKLLRATLDSSGDMIQVFEAVRNEQGEIIDFIWILNNHASEKFYGDVVGKRLLERQPGVGEEGIFDAFKQVVETGLPQQYEKHYVHEQFDGWFHQSVVKLNDGVVTTTADITLRKTAQQQLQHSQAFLQSVIDSSLDVIQVFKAVRDETGAIRDFVWLINNQKAVAQNGEVIGKSLLEQNPGVVPTGIFDRMIEVAQTGVAYEQEQYYPHEQFEGWFYQALVKTDDGVTMTTRDISRQKQAEQEVLRLKDEVAQQLTDKYQVLFKSIDQGFNIIELIFDDQGHVIDYWQREHNPVFTRMTGLTDVINKQMSELIPSLEPQWHQMIERIYYTGEPIRVEYPVAALGQWYTAYMSRVGEAGSPFIACLYDDITERKRQQQEQAFLLTLGDTLKPLTDPVTIEGEITQLLRAHVDAGWCYYVEWDEVTKLGLVRRDAAKKGLASLAGAHDVSHVPEFLELLKTNPLLAVSDYETYDMLTPELRQGYTSLGFRSMLVATLVKQERLVASLLIGDTTIRHWSTQEQALLMQVAERTWAAVERAKAEAALRASQQRFASIANLVPDLLWQSNSDGFTNWYNDRWLDYTGQTFEEAIGWGWVETIHPDDRQESARRYTQAVTAGTWLRQEYRIRRHNGAYRWFVVTAFPFQDERGRVVNMYGAATDIHDRKLTEEALRHSEAKFRQLSDSGLVAVAFFDIGGPIVDANEAFLHLLGVTKEDLQSEKVRWDVYTAREWLPRTQQAIEEFKQTGYISPYEKSFYHTNGSLRWGIFAGATLGDGKTGVSLVVDITQRKQAEEALGEREQQLRLITDAMPALISYIDAGFHYRFANQYYQYWFGLPPEEIIGQSMQEFLGEAAFERIRPYSEAALAGQRQSFEEEIAYRYGGTRYVQSEYVPDLRPDGSVAGYYALVTDLTERKRAEAALQESEKRLRLTIDATELATWEWNLETDEVYWNEQHFRLFGLEPRPNPISSDVFMRHVHPREQDRIKELLERAIAERDVYDTEFCAVLEDGSTRWMSGYGRITEERDGQAVLMSGVMFDVDERRRAEEALQRADQRKDEFLAMLAHELRNPMSTLRSGLTILDLTLTEEMGLGATVAPTVAMMSRQTDHLVRMVDDLLDVSRISRGKIELKTERVELVELVRQAQQSLAAEFEQQQKVLHARLSDTPIPMEGDATRLTQVVVNLLTNGLRYSGEGGQVWLSLDHRGQEAILEVRDNGIGLAANQLLAIFELFVQVDNSTARSKGGLGLGLTLVKRLVEMHGGQVEAQSDGIGQGSTFTVHLPTLVAAEPTPTATPPVTNPAAAQRILVIDDNADAGFTLGMLLKLKGYETHTRHSGRAGIEAAEALRPSAILLDIGMPGMDGYETCRLIRQQAWGQDLVIIALTGYGQEEDRQQSRAAGFNGHLVKPVDLGALTSLLTDLLDKDQYKAG